MEINITRDYVFDIFEFTDAMVDEKLTKYYRCYHMID